MGQAHTTKEILLDGITKPGTYHFDGGVVLGHAVGNKYSNSPTIIEVTDGDLIITGDIKPNVILRVTNGDLIIQKRNPNFDHTREDDASYTEPRYIPAPLPPLEEVTVNGGMLYAKYIEDLPITSKNAAAVNINSLVDAQLRHYGERPTLELACVGDRVHMHIQNAHANVGAVGVTSKVCVENGDAIVSNIGYHSAIEADNITVDDTTPDTNLKILDKKSSLKARDTIRVNSDRDIATVVRFTGKSVFLQSSTGVNNRINISDSFHCGNTVRTRTQVCQFYRDEQQKTPASVTFKNADPHSKFSGNMNIHGYSASNAAKFDEVEGNVKLDISPQKNGFLGR
jgi:hypothetical protein